MNYLGLLFFLIIFFTGCSPKFPISYSPSSTMIINGEMKIENFEYLPPQKFKIKENQIRNTALGSYLFEKDINQYFRDALFNESRLVGININSNKNILTGQINDFFIDDLGYSIDWIVDVKYDLKKNGDLCFSKVKIINKNTNKFLNFFVYLNEMIKFNVEELFKDEDFKNCIK